MTTDNEIKPVEVFAGTTMQANMVKNLLEDTEIEAFLNDEFIGTLNPWIATPGGIGAVKVFVSSSDYEKAKEVVEQYENHLKSDN